MNKTFGKIPRHVAIIMDGNGRWAQSEGQERLYGHKRGVDSVRAVVRTAADLGVEYLTIYAFSTENWGRPEQEVDGLMQLLSYTIINEVEPLAKNSVRLKFIGDIAGLPEQLQKSVKIAEEFPIEAVKMTLVIALNYSSRWEIVRAVQCIVSSGIEADQVTEQVVEQYLCTRDIPEPELMIRTSGEQRLSNFMLWQLSYTELYFTSVLWPEFGEGAFLEAIAEYNNRDRRFGKVK